MLKTTDLRPHFSVTFCAALIHLSPLFFILLVSLNALAGFFDGLYRLLSSLSSRISEAGVKIFNMPAAWLNGSERFFLPRS